MATQDQVQICSEALIMLGEEPIESFEAGTTPSQVAANLYQSTADQLMADHPWRFTRRMEALNRSADQVPIGTGYSSAYAIPSGCLRIIAPFIGGIVAPRWEPSETVIWLDASPTELVELEYHARVDEQRWTVAFRQAVVLAMAAAMAVPIRDDAKIRDLYLRDMATQLARAKHQNASERPARQLMRHRFAALRRR